LINLLAPEHIILYQAMTRPERLAANSQPGRRPAPNQTLSNRRQSARGNARKKRRGARTAINSA